MIRALSIDLRETDARAGLWSVSAAIETQTGPAHISATVHRATIDKVVAMARASAKSLKPYIAAHFRDLILPAASSVAVHPVLQGVYGTGRNHRAATHAIERRGAPAPSPRGLPASRPMPQDESLSQYALPPERTGSTTVGSSDRQEATSVQNTPRLSAREAEFIASFDAHAALERADQEDPDACALLDRILEDAEGGSPVAVALHGKLRRAVSDRAAERSGASPPVGEKHAPTWIQVVPNEEFFRDARHVHASEVFGYQVDSPSQIAINPWHRRKSDFGSE